MKRYSWLFLFLLNIGFLNAAKNNWSVFLNFPNGKMQLVDNFDFTKINEYSVKRKYKTIPYVWILKSMMDIGIIVWM